MKRVRAGTPTDSSSDDTNDDEDAFSSLTHQTKKKKLKHRPTNQHHPPLTNKTDGNTTTDHDNVVNVPIIAISSTTSNKRHHNVSSIRKAKLDSLLLELQQTETKAVVEGINPYEQDEQNLTEHIKGGSHVREGEEHLTTNLFVSGLAPSVTEEQLTELFRQVGDLYSVKIMWPRTMEERARGRNTGFVCFMNREDAEVAMDTFAEKDPFETGYNLMLRWGKNVKMTVKKGTGGIPVPPIARKEATGPAFVDPTNNNDKDTRIVAHTLSQQLHQDVGSPSAVPTIIPYSEQVHGSNSIRVEAPKDQNRAKFISTIASFVAKDGSALEWKLMERESGNPEYGFLFPPGQNQQPSASFIIDDDIEIERKFYRWRVYAFGQGCMKNSWRTAPFQMFVGGRFWIPPPVINEDAAKEEAAQLKKMEKEIQEKKEERKRLAEEAERKREMMTGRQLEHAKFGGGTFSDAKKMTDNEKARVNRLLLRLCASRQSICEAMVHFLNNSSQADQVSQMLKESILDANASIDSRIARLYLLSDVLYNSQQPGVRNAFQYRSFIEKMSPQVFKSLGESDVGRISMNKLRKAVSTVLNAWTHWSVYTPDFIEELDASFRGKELSSSSNENNSNNNMSRNDKDSSLGEESPATMEKRNEKDSQDEEWKLQNLSGTGAHNRIDMNKKVSIHKNPPLGDWNIVDNEERTSNKQSSTIDAIVDEDLDGEAFDDDEDLDGEPLDSDEDLDGEPMDDDDLDDALDKL